MTKRARWFALFSSVTLLLALSAYGVFRNIQDKRAQRLFANRRSCILVAARYAKSRDGMIPRFGLIMENSVERSDYSESRATCVAIVHYRYLMPDRSSGEFPIEGIYVVDAGTGVTLTYNQCDHGDCTSADEFGATVFSTYSAGKDISALTKSRF
jgi:hypothetical protein